MKIARIIGALVAVLAITAVGTSSALALVNVEALVLSGEAFPVKFEGKAGKGSLVTLGGKSIECEKVTFSGEVKDSRKDNAKFTFTGCKSSGFACNTAGDASGTILTEGTSLLVFDSLKGEKTELLPAILFTVEPATKIECTALAKLEVKGTLLILFAKLTSGTFVTSTGVILEQEGGDPKDKTYWEDEKEQHPSLLANFNGGGFETSGIGTKEAEIKYAKMLALDF